MIEDMGSRPMVTLLPILLSMACGRAWMGPGFDGGDASSETEEPTTTAAASTDSPDDPTTTTDAPDDPCHGGVVLREVPYTGQAERTVGHGLARAADGTLLLSGTRAGASTMAMWLAATDPEGALRWEATALPQPGGNLAGWTPTIGDLHVDGDALRFAGFTRDEVASGWIGSATLGGEIVALEGQQGALWNGLAPGPAGFEAVVGLLDPSGIVIAGLEDGQLVWSEGSVGGGPYDDVAADVATQGELLFVAGRRQEQAWVTAFTTSGAPLWERQVPGTPSLEAESGSLEAIGTHEDLVVAAGSLRLSKPMPDGDGSYTFNQVVVAAWTLDGEPQWTWQRDPDVVRPGLVQGLAIGHDGTVLVTGSENAIHGTPYFFAAGLSPDGALEWAIDDETQPDDPRLVSVEGTAIVAGEPGQAWVLGNAGGLSEETTTLLELCH